MSNIEEGNQAASDFAASLNRDRIKEIIEYQKSLLDRYNGTKDKDRPFYQQYLKQLELEQKLLQEMIHSDYESSGLDSDSDKEEEKDKVDK